MTQSRKGFFTVLFLGMLVVAFLIEELFFGRFGTAIPSAPFVAWGQPIPMEVFILIAALFVDRVQYRMWRIRMEISARRFDLWWWMDMIASVAIVAIVGLAVLSWVAPPIAAIILVPLTLSPAVFSSLTLVAAASFGGFGLIDLIKRQIHVVDHPGLVVGQQGQTNTQGTGGSQHGLGQGSVFPPMTFLSPSAEQEFLAILRAQGVSIPVTMAISHSHNR